jgi:hypothetical protein
MQTYSYTETVFTGFICVLGRKPQEPVGPNPRREPKTCGTLHLSREDAAECSYFANADEPAPDALRWTVYAVPGINAPLAAYLGDEAPVYPEGCVTTSTIKELLSAKPIDRKEWDAACTPATCQGPVMRIERTSAVRITLRAAIDHLKAFGNVVTADALITWLTADADTLPPRFEDLLHRVARALDEHGFANTADAVRKLPGHVRFGACEHVAAEAVSC